MKSHAYADLFPMMTTVELDALAEDIAANGLMNSIVRYEGKILDGRNRFEACKKAGVEPSYTDHDGDDASALALVISLNIQRRDMTSAQRAIVAARALPRFEELRSAGRPKKEGGTHPNNGRSRQDASSVFKVGAQSIQQAKAVLAESPDLAEQVETCTLSLAAAYEQLLARRAKAKQKAQDADRIAEYREAISNGEMTADQAIQKAIDEEREKREEHDSKARALQKWVKELLAFVVWVETYPKQFGDEYLRLQFAHDSPGQFEHGITRERMQEVKFQIARIEAALEEGHDGARSKRSPKSR